MARHIDADRLEKEMYHEAFETDTDMQKWDGGCWIRYKMFENCIAQQPTADVVEVVRCKKCKHFEKMESEDSYFCNKFGGYVKEDDYCSRGAKMDGKKVE